MLSKVKNLFPAIAILIISSLIFLTRLGSNSLADWDEAWYADASRFMFENDHFLTPIWNNQYFFDKPPLQYWLTQPFLYFFGETELAYRLPSALAAIALTLVTYLWGIQQVSWQKMPEGWRARGPQSSARSPDPESGRGRRTGVERDRTPTFLTGLTAVIILLTFPHFLDRGRSGNFDSLFVFFTTLSMFMMVKNRPALGGIFLGLSWLTKGVFSGLFPVAVFFLISMKNFAPKWLSKLTGLLVDAPQPADPKISFSRQPRRSQVKHYWQTVLGATTRLARIPSRACRENDTEGQPGERPIVAGAKLKSLLVYIFFAVLIYAPWHLLQYSRFDHLINQSYFATFDQGEFGSASWMDIAWRFDLRYLVFLWTLLRWWFPILLISLIYQFWKFAKLLASKRGFANFQTNFLPLISFSVIFFALSAAKSKNDWYIMPAYPFIALMIADTLGSLRNFLSRNVVSQTSPDSRFITFITFITIISFSAANLIRHWNQAFPLDKWLPEKELGLTVKNLTGPSDLVVTAEYEFPTLRYYSERQVRTAARQPDYEGKYWWIWDNTDIATALRRGQNIVTIHRPGTEWPIDVYGYHREKLSESNHRIISRLIPNNP